MDPDGAEVWRPHSWVEEESDAKVPPGGGGGDGSEQPPAVAAPSAAMPAEVAAAMSVKELKAALAKRGVSVSGLAEKADLVAALVAAPPPKPEMTLVEVTAMEASAPGTRYFGVTVDKTDKMKLAHWVLNSQPHECSAGLIELVRALPAQPRQQMLSHLESDLRRAVLAGLKSWPASAPAPTPAPPGSKGVAASRAAAEQGDSGDKDGESGEDDNDGKGVRDGEGDDDNGDGNGGSKDDNDDDDDDEVGEAESDGAAAAAVIVGTLACAACKSACASGAVGACSAQRRDTTRNKEQLTNDTPRVDQSGQTNTPKPEASGVADTLGAATNAGNV